MSTPRWTVEGARVKRSAELTRRKRLQSFIAHQLGGPVRFALKAASKVAGTEVYRPSLNQAARRINANVLFLRFENIKVRPKVGISQIALHLGINLAPEQLERIADATSFEAMKVINYTFYPVCQTTWITKGGKIICRGSIGEGDTLFSPEASAEFRSRMALGLAGVGSDFSYYGFAPNPEKDSA